MKPISRPSYGALIVAAACALALVAGSMLWGGRMKVKRGDALMNELGAVRSAVALYRMKNGRFPSSISALAEETYPSDSGQRPWLQAPLRVREGVAVDPFGAPYRYDPGNGSFSSSSAGYESW